MASYSELIADAGVEITSLVELVRWRGVSQPARIAYRFLADGEREEVSLTYGDLYRRARAVAAALQDLRAHDERVLLLFPPGPDYVCAFFGCLLAGAIAVPAYPPRPNRSAARLQMMAADAGASFALTTTPHLSRLEAFIAQTPDFKRLRWLATDAVDEALVGQWREPAVSKESLAYLQYTSGSTATPKGVMVTHANVLHNSAYIHQGFAHTPESVSLCWLPHFHDMGLLDGIVQPLYGSFTGLLMPPTAFLQRPARWLEAISRHRVTHSGGPNFAYDLCVRKVSAETRATLDLGSWRVAYNGAEPVRAETLRRFADTFAPCGFRPTVFYPAYGLAEATLKVAGGTPGAGAVTCTVSADALEQNRIVETSPQASGAHTLVSSGRATFETEVLIVNPETLIECGPDEVGEIWVGGPGVAAGYWNRAAETEHTFQARLADGGGAGPYLRTGDLGFIRQGELFVTGRLKDLIIIRGRNLYPQDIEAVVERCHPALRPGGSAAFAVETDGAERLVVVQELEQRRQADLPAIMDAIRETLAAEFEVQPAAILLVKTGAVPKTSSGKVQRNLCRQKFLRQQFDTAATWHASAELDAELYAPTDAHDLTTAEAIEQWLRAQLARALRVAVADIDVRRPATHYGVDSLLAIELMHGLETALGVRLSLADLLDSPSLAELAARAFAESKLNGTRPPLIASSPLAETNLHPLSHGQRALWFLAQVAPESSAYNVAAAVGIKTELDVAALHRAFQSLVDRHPALRTTFGATRGEPAQLIHERMTVSFRQADAAGCDEVALKDRLSEEAHRPFDLEHGPLLRVTLFRQTSQHYFLLIVAHHIVVDLWSLALLLEELGELYRAETDGMTPALAPSAASYTDYVYWQSELLAGAAGARLATFWQKELADAVPTLSLDTDKPRPPAQTYRGAAEHLRFDARLTAQLKELSQAHNATLYMTLLAAFQALLYRYTGQEDLLVGSPTAGRSAARFARTVGYFVNPVVLRARPVGALPFVSFLAQVRQTVLGAFAHQEYPFDLLVTKLQPERDPGRSPLFQVMFAFNQAHLLKEEGLAAFALGEEGARLQLGGLPLESVRLEQRVAQFDLALTVAEVDDELSAALEYNTDLFEAATIKRALGHLRTLLESIAADPHRKLAELPLLTPAERQQVISAGSRTSAARAPAGFVHELFEQRAAEAPNEWAVRCEGGQISYGELNARANRLAHSLRVRGVGPDVLVGLCAERSVEALAGMLGVLKAGGAYVPLDPAYPPDRLAFMLADSGARVLLTTRRLAEQLPARGVAVVELDADKPAHASDENPRCHVSDESLAYVIYTSGSTGVPKGVAVTHCALARFTEAAARAYQITRHDRVLQFASLSFDTSVEEIYPCLTRGATLVLAPRAAQADAAAFLRLCRDERLSVLDLPTAFWHELVANLSGDDWARAEDLRLVILGGEEAHAERVHRWHDSVGARVRLVNTYGPTEATVVATACDLTDWARDGARVVPIGRPLPHAEAYVLDEAIQPAPVGVRGELYLGGDGLARGYLNRPQLTAEKFIPHPFSGEPGARLYRTGDLARLLPDGQLEFLGRADQQVKVRGYRIELGEIEAALRRHAGVRDALVVAGESGRGGKRLTAYVVPAQPASPPSASALRDFLTESLPDYMLPSAFVVLPEWPLTPTGKLDRRALPAPGTPRTAERECTAPRTPREQTLCAIWADVLKVERVGVHDNFFELGGDSILSIQVIARAQQAGIAIAPQQMFERPTVAELAAAADGAGVPAQETLETFAEDSATPRAAGRTPADFPLAGLEQHQLDELLQTHPDVTDIYPLSPMQQGILFHSVYEPDADLYAGQVTYTLAGTLDADALARAWQHLVGEHTALRTSFVWEGLNEPLQLVHGHASAALERHDWRALAADEQTRRLASLCAAERQRGFKLGALPLVRLALVRLDDDTAQLVGTYHHILLDGWSLSVLLAELLAAYEAFAQGREITDRRARPYRDYIAWQRRQDAESARAFWRETLKGFTAPTPLAIARADAAAAEDAAESGRRQLRLSAKLTAALRERARERRLTLNTLVQGAWAVLLSRYSREEDVLFGATMSGRAPALAGVDEMVGLFINTLPVRVRVPAEAALLDWLKGLQLNLARLRAYEYSPLVEVQGWSDVPRGTPLFESLVVFENFPAEAGTLRERAGLRLGEAHSYERTNYPLTIIAVPGAELSFEALYAAGRFDAAAVERLLGHLQTILESMTGEQWQRVADLPLLTAAERRQLLIEWNDTAAEYPRDQSIQGLFEAQVERTPAATALACGGERLSYAELNARANRLARHLRGLGVGPEVPVGICAARTAAMVVGLLGILKAGGAYVALDPLYPRERLAFMMEDAGCPVLLTEQHLAERIPAHGARVVRLDADQELIARADDANLTSGVTPENLAYVIYTSGSTGRPKGVGITHRSAVAFSCWARASFAPEVFAGSLCLSSFCFDLSVFELFVPLHWGGTVVLVENILQVPALAAEPEVTLVNTVPSAIGELLRLGHVPASARTINLAGEPLPAKLVRQLYELPQVEQVFNLYGPTEDTTYSTWGLMRRGTDEPPSIGRPVHNTRAYLLDPAGQPVPVGIVGELYLGGDGLARGYLGRPELTAERFVPDPFSREPGARLYRTGDLARYLPDGEIDFLGRMDHQVKVRGYRIELGEIEAALSQHPAVRDCAVLAREDAPGDKRLVAYVVGKQGQPPESELRGFLKERLLDHMLPSSFVLLDELPLTPNGKINRRALPAPEEVARPAAEDYVAPRTPVEEVLAGIWREVLRVERVGAHDNFFDLGGHSLLATRVLHRVRKVFKAELPLHVVFEARTLAELAGRVVAHEARPGQAEKIARLMQKVKGLSAAELRAELEQKRSEKGTA